MIKLETGVLYRYAPEDDYVFYVTEIDKTSDFPMRSIDIVNGQQLTNAWYPELMHDDVIILGPIEDYPEYFL